MIHPRSLRGFTLIELLVVIAIIAILSAVMLGSLGLGRLKAADASIKANLHTVQQQMEIYYSNNSNSYGTTVSQSSSVSTGPTSVGTHVYAADSVVNGAMKEVVRQSGNVYYSVGPSGSTWAVAAKLKADSGYWWCVDSTGQPKREQDGTAISTAGNTIGGGASAAVCP
jgi:prepilin-type N-terminal cleavage/methylation domain-containing protein